MKNAAHIPLVTTDQERCRVCYTCVRECPAKAIRIFDGQAEVISERCIGCGNCVRVCSQQAKRILNSRDAVIELLAGGAPVAAIVAPSFPAEFSNISYQTFVGMIRELGFEYINEVAFGADLVARQYHELLLHGDKEHYIATNCPAIVAYVERYFPDLVDSLAPIVSPMVATARTLKKIHGDALRIVFIGPCIAKKGERASDQVAPEVDEALTFSELKTLFRQYGIASEAAKPQEFDPPHGGMGALLPINRGLLQAAGIEEDLLTNQVVSAAGRAEFVDAIKEFASGDLGARLLEILACSGCIDGPGIECETPLFRKRRSVSDFVRKRSESIALEQWRNDIERFLKLDLSRRYAKFDQRIQTASREELSHILHKLGKFRSEDELNCGACGYDTCREHAEAIFKGLAEDEMCLPYVIDQLSKTVKDLAVSNDRLAETREALLQSEKLASMGQLAAGIAHELNNPLGVVLMYAHLLKEESVGNEELRDDLIMVAEQADRCKKIVKGLLDFARQNEVELAPVKVDTLVEHTLKATPTPDNVKVDLAFEQEEITASLDRDQMQQVLTNLLTNAYAAMPEGGTVSIKVSLKDDIVSIRVSDTGTGISQKNRGKIFDPFFSTKDIGKGTGLGLAVSYGIVKMHRGDIAVASNDDPAAGPTGTTFTLTLPTEHWTARVESGTDKTT